MVPVHFDDIGNERRERLPRIGYPLLLATLISMVTASSVVAESPAFDCAKASGEIETLICEAADLAALDQELAAVYTASLQKLKGAADEKAPEKSLKAHQRGWIKGRNDCRKAENKLGCTENAYRTRTAELQVRYGLVPGSEPTFFVCNRNRADEIVATYYRTDPEVVRLERGDSQIIALQARAASGVRYVADSGIVFWGHHGEALVEWPQGTKFECTAR